MPKITRETKIKREKEKLYQIFQAVPAKQQALVEGLIERSAFMKVTLEELEAQIMDHGTVEQYQHGENQSGMKASAGLQAYNSTIKNYATVIKQLVSLLPETEQKEIKKNSLMELLEESRRGKR